MSRRLAAVAYVPAGLLTGPDAVPSGKALAAVAGPAVLVEPVPGAGPAVVRRGG